ncbi:NAD-dependent protein deacetylase Sirtuin [Acrasis kona]|uniref:NAD-dependent protein deacetylase Sirtuin n=1 Tax=Acrasis kona TaxID=1008807 RepID=A0AAW2YQH6_9EUKA
MKRGDRRVPRLEVKSYYEAHGHFGSDMWPCPRIVAESEEACRKDQGNTIKANEYLDEPEVVLAKVKKIAELIKKAKFCVAYTGAGLSRSSGIPDYASKAPNTIIKIKSISTSLNAVPTYAHRVITALERSGYVHYYVRE